MLTFAAIFFAFIACTNAPKVNNGAETSAQKQAGKETSLTLNEELHKSFSTNNKRDSDENVSYPAYFGGSYTGTKDRLVILVKKLDKNGIADIYERIGKHPNLFFKSCTYSLNELNEIKEVLDKKYFGNPSLRKKLNWISSGINIEQNRIVVFLGKLSSQCIADFKKNITDSPMLVFEEMHEAEEFHGSCKLLPSEEHNRCSM